MALPLLFSAAVALDNGLGELPPMGWNSWNLAGCAINETFFRDTVDALAAKGFKEAGYTYINLDEYAAFLCTASALLVFVHCFCVIGSVSFGSSNRH